MYTALIKPGGGNLGIRILLVDNHRIVREGIRTLLEKNADLRVVGEAGNGEEAIHLTRELLPDVILMDITMPDLNGVEATLAILKNSPAAKIIGLSVHCDKRFASEMFKAGAKGYLTKDCAFEELIKAIRTVIAGRIYLSAAIAENVIGSFVASHSDSDALITPRLSARERIVLQLISEGKSTKEIAGELNLSIKTIETYRLKLMNKLGITNLAGLVKYAIREGLTSVEK
jgi:two-component system response regulator NreC